MKLFTATLTSLEWVGARYAELTLRLNEPGWSHRPGQYTQLFFSLNPEVKRIYSIASARQDELCFCIQLGDPQLEDHVKDLQVGVTQLQVSEAAGRFHNPPYAQPVVLLAGGSGITPLKAILEDRIRHGATSTVLYGCYSDADIPYRQALQDLAASHPKLLTLAIFAERLDDGRLGVIQGRPTQVLPDHIARDSAYLMCGPPVFMDTVRLLLSENGVTDIHQDQY